MIKRREATGLLFLLLLAVQLTGENVMCVVFVGMMKTFDAKDNHI